MQNRARSCRLSGNTRDERRERERASEEGGRKGHSTLVSRATEIEHGNTRVRGVNTEREGERKRQVVHVLHALVVVVMVVVVVAVAVVVVFVERGWCNSDTRSLTEFLPVGVA